jgi:hypothetical protein
MKKSSKKYNSFIFNTPQVYCFLEFKHLYEEDIPSAYRKNKKRSLKKDVNNIIKYGAYNQPEVLRDILLGKYAYLSFEKFEEILRTAEWW